MRAKEARPFNKEKPGNERFCSQEKGETRSDDSSGRRELERVLKRLMEEQKTEVQTKNSTEKGKIL